MGWRSEASCGMEHPRSQLGNLGEKFGTKRGKRETLFNNKNSFGVFQRVNHWPRVKRVELRGTNDFGQDLKFVKGTGDRLLHVRKHSPVAEDSNLGRLGGA